MSFIQTMMEPLQFNRDRTLATLDRIEKIDNPEVLGWRPGVGRAHLAWQFMHIGITEDIFASQRLVTGEPRFEDLWDRFRGGSQPDEDIPQLSQIRDVLEQSRKSLIATLESLGEDVLDSVPEGLQERGWTVRTAVSVMNWHESHHQGQAHLTVNLFENQ